MSNEKRVHLVLDKDAQATLQALKEATGATSRAEVLRDALGVYNSLQSLLSKSGHQFLALLDLQAGEFQEIRIPSLAAKKRASEQSGLVRASERADSRREHAHRVWNSAQAVIGMVCLLESLHPLSGDWCDATDEALVRMGWKRQ